MEINSSFGGDCVPLKYWFWCNFSHFMSWRVEMVEKIRA
jgi:hypothetical protein